MTIENNYFSNFSLVEQFICSAISFIPKDDTFELYEQIDDHIIFEAAKKNDVDSIIGYRLIEKYGKDNIPPHWVNSYKSTNEKIAFYLEELDKISSLFANEGIPLVALKNVGIARAIYNKTPACCPMGDIDVLTEKKYYDNAQAILLKNGYNFKARNSMEMAYYKELPNGKSLWLELLVRTIDGRWVGSDQEPKAEEVLLRAIPISGTTAKLLSPEDNLLQVSLHTSKHTYVRAPGFRLHTDVDRIVNSSKINWNVFINRVKRHGVSTTVYFSLLIPTELFGTPIPADVLYQLSPKKCKKKLISAWLNKVGIFNPDESKFSKMGFIIFNILLYDNFTVFIRNLFPTTKLMKESYNFNFTLLLPYYYLLRIINLIFKRAKT